MGGAIFFVLTLVATMIVGTYVLAYAAHCFFTVVEQTAAGNDEVVWPNIPYTDWLWEAVYILWLSALWLAPFAFTVSGRAGTAGLITSAEIGRASCRERVESGAARAALKRNHGRIACNYSITK